ncbi:MAG TPA: MFS transporter [Moraxellaceae bacterium]|nr:MFS transporter [Moraxellaceae bacterium]
MSSHARIPHIPLASFYFFYFAVLGGFMPYWGLYLQQLSFSPEAIGQLMAILMATRIVAPNFWGYVADRTGKRLQMVQLAAFLLMFFWLGVFFTDHFWPLAFVLLGYSFFQNAILAQFEAVTIAHLGTQRELYSRLRLWGSVGFIVTGASLGMLFDHVSVGWLPLCLLVFAAASWLASLRVPDIATPTQAHRQENFLTILKRPTVVAFLLAHFLLQLSHAPYYSFYSIYLEQHGYSRSAIGWLWALAVMAEVIAFTQMHRWLPRFGEQRIMVVSLLLAAARWAVIGVGIESPVVVWSAQLLHAASFATFHAAAISVIYRQFGDGHQGQGQALYSMLWGLGVALGSWWTGMVWDIHPLWSWLAASAACIIAALVLIPRGNPSH